MRSYVNIFGKSVAVVIKDLPRSQAGHFDPDKWEIQIAPNHTSNHEILHTLIHEMLHCLFVRVSIIQAKVSEDVLEIICDTVATCILENFDLKDKSKNKKRT